MAHAGNAQTRTKFSELGRYVATWRFPKVLASIDYLFSPKKISTHYKNMNFACSASELLTLTPVLLCYLTRIVAVRDVGMAPLVESMVAALCVVEILSAVKTGLATPQALRGAIHKHMRLFIDAYGRDACLPKHHYALHLPEIFQRRGTLLSTFTNERRHRVVKRYTRDRRCLSRR